MRAVVAALSSSLVRRRVPCLGASVLVAILLGGVASQLSFRFDLDDFDLADVGAPDAVEQLPEVVSGRDRLLIVLDARTSLKPDHAAEVIERLAGLLEVSAGVSRRGVRRYRAEHRFVEDVLPRHVLLFVDPDSLPGLARRLQPPFSREAMVSSRTGQLSVKDPLGFGTILSSALHNWAPGSRVVARDGFFSLPGDTIHFFEVVARGPLSDMQLAGHTVRKIAAVLAEYSESDLRQMAPAARLFVAGHAVSLGSQFGRHTADLRRVSLAALLVVSIVLWVSFRRPVAVLALMATVFAGTLAVAAVAAIVLGSISIGSWIFVALLLGLGVDFGIYIVTYFWYGAGPQSDADAAARLADSVLQPGRAIIVTAATTATAFASVALVPTIVTREVALLLVAGMLCMLLASFVLLPVLLVMFAAPARRDGREIWSRAWTRIHDRDSAWELTPWVVLIATGIATLPAITFAHDQWAVLRGDPHTAQLEELTRQTGLALPPIAIVSRGGTPELAIRRDRETALDLVSMGLSANIAAVQSLARWLPSLEDQRFNISYVRAHQAVFDAARFRSDFLAALPASADRYLTSEYLPSIETALRAPSEPLTLDGLRSLGMGQTVDAHLSGHDGAFNAVSLIYLRTLPWNEGGVERFLSAVDESGLRDRAGVTVYDDHLRTGDFDRAIGRWAILSSLVAFAGVSLILVGRFRRLLPCLLCLAPLLCSLSAVVLLMRALGIALDLYSMLVAPVLVGIAVDDGIHMVDRLTSRQGVDTLMRETGRAMTVTTLTTAGAFLCLSLASVEGIRRLGLLGAVGVGVALVAALHLVPLGWRLAERAGEGDAPALSNDP